MSFTEAQVKELSGDLDMTRTKTRKLYGEEGRELTYIPSHYAIREANRIFGFDGWTREVVDFREVQCEQRQNSKGKMQWYVSYIGRVSVAVEGIIRQGCGYGQGIDADLGQAHESAWKEMESDSLKRALMTFGDPFGLCLYDKDFFASQSSPASRQRQRPADAPPVTQGNQPVSPSAPVAPKDPEAKDAVAKLMKERAWDPKAPQFEWINQVCKIYGWNSCRMILNGMAEGCESLVQLVEFVNGAGELARKEREKATA